MPALVIARDKFDPARGLTYAQYESILIRRNLKQLLVRKLAPRDAGTTNLDENATIADERALDGVLRSRQSGA